MLGAKRGTSSCKLLGNHSLGGNGRENIQSKGKQLNAGKA